MPDEKLRDGIFPGPSGAYDFYSPGDDRILGWLKESLQEGERVNRGDPSWSKMDEAMSYVMGEQIKGDDGGESMPSYVPRIVVNQTKKAIRTHVSALTDLQPLFAFKHGNNRFQTHAHMLNQIVVMWWVNTFADLELADTVRYSLVGGAGDMVVEWDPYFTDHGDTRLMARDPRDTLPIRPERTRSLQDWEGLTIRECHSVNKLRAFYPEYANEIVEDSGLLGQVYTRFRQAAVMTTPVSTLDGLKDRSPNAKRTTFPETTLYRTVINDRSVNRSGEPRLMGPPSANWSYIVPPGHRLYPQRRLIVWTEKRVCYDGPAPYWHGNYMVTRLRLDPWPWLFMGLGLLHDMAPGQDAINKIVNYFIMTLSQWVERGSIWDKNMPDPLFRRFDPRKPRWKVKMNRQFGEGMALQDGPALPTWAMQFLGLMFQKFDELSGTANLTAFLQLRQMPGRDTIEKYLEALTPEIRLEARQIEAFLRDVATQVKGNIFQYYSRPRRMMLLGDAGSLIEDFDYDPDTLIPAMSPDQEGYIEELDASLPRHHRARFFMNQFQFYVAPNSMLALQATERKLLYLQLARQGYMDFWSLGEMLGIPNLGQPPEMPLPMLRTAPGTTPATNPLTGESMPILELRQPITVTERLMAQQQLGIGQVVSPAGRKATGQVAPHMEQKAGRTVISESE